MPEHGLEGGARNVLKKTVPILRRLRGRGGGGIHDTPAFAGAGGKGDGMRGLRAIFGALTILGASGASIEAWAAAPAGLDPEPQRAVGAAAPNAAGLYQLEVEMTVKNWVLCVSQPLAEGLLKARETSRDDFLTAYARAAAAHTCGQMPQMQVKLQKAVYEFGAGGDQPRHCVQRAGQPLRRLGDRVCRAGRIGRARTSW